ncbi:Uncharacterised protein [BD1-7 clade bacterium]|uniref:EamA domain-containing protein n=1 Tax=BD1-7 clade bacterium TaxID=2029982 RepID=A0A5S9QZ75_9GAMM|nr:Uncharacterised protein [BD1-7 clade bacterium]
MANSVRGPYVAGLLAVSVLWAGTFLFVKVADRDIPPLTVMAARAVISCSFMLLVLAVLRKPLLQDARSLRHQASFAICGLLVAYMWFTIARSETVLSASHAAFLITFLPVSSWLIGVFLAHTRVFRWINLLGAAVAVSGIGFMVGLDNILRGGNELWSSLLYISGLLAFSVSATLNKRWCTGIDPFVLTTFNLFYAALGLGTLALIFDAPFSASYHQDSLLALFGLGVFSTGVGYLIFYWLVLRAGAEFACLNGYLVPVLGVLMGVMFLGESVTSLQILGLFVALSGIYLSEWDNAS